MQNFTEYITQTELCSLSIWKDYDHAETFLLIMNQTKFNLVHNQKKIFNMIIILSNWKGTQFCLCYIFCRTLHRILLYILYRIYSVLKGNTIFCKNIFQNASVWMTQIGLFWSGNQALLAGADQKKIVRAIIVWKEAVIWKLNYLFCLWIPNSPFGS